MGTAGRAEFERAGCILIWGNNSPVTRLSLMPLIERGRSRGAKLIVIDPRKTELASKADLHLQVRPGTDGALALGMLRTMIEENLYDSDFTRDWTTAPFLIRSDNGNLLRGTDLVQDADPSSYVLVDSTEQRTITCQPGTMPSSSPALDATYTVTLASGDEVECKTAFRLLREETSAYPPNRTEALTGVPANKIRDAVRMLTTERPARWFAWNGIEQNINASQTNRAVCILYALTGDFDSPGGNVILPSPPTNPIIGSEFLNPGASQKRLGYKERPLGPNEVQAYEVYKAILTGEPYPVKALFAFGGNWITSNTPPLVAREALGKLDLHVQSELFLTPTAEMADIVLPAASSWEAWHVGTNIAPLGNKAYIQMRPTVAPPQHESWPDIKIVFELAKRLGLGDKFWGGDIEAAFNYHLAPSGITVEQLRDSPGGIAVDLSMEYQKYRKEDGTGNFAGFSTPSKRVEIYSQVFKDHGYDPLPNWREPPSVTEEYPLVLTAAKVIQFCHSQHRALPSLRKAVPHPFLEINPVKAGELGISDGDWVIVETRHGGITLKARLTAGIPHDVVSTQNGWWQGCPELNLPGYDPFSREGANVNFLFSAEEKDPISGSLPHKGYPCSVKKITIQE
jgi:anaerobic selenocysteine-containing dehydrogenase